MRTRSARTHSDKGAPSQERHRLRLQLPISRLVSYRYISVSDAYSLCICISPVCERAQNAASGSYRLRGESQT